MASVWHNHKLTLSIFGESHGTAIGAVLDGFPAGISLDMTYLLRYMERRMTGGTLSTKRKEPDIPQIQSGVQNGITNGFPIAFLIENTDQNSSSYDTLALHPRPNHADYTAWKKYGEFADLRGGGHFSGRLTAPLVFAGALCAQFLRDRGIEIGAHITRIAGICDRKFDPCHVTAEELRQLKQKAFPVLEESIALQFYDKIQQAQEKGDSVGAEIECAVVGLPPALGEHMFDGIEGVMSSLLFGIPAVKGVQFGTGFGFSDLYGTEANDAFIMTEENKVCTKSNHCGGVLGGMTNGMPVLFSVAIKPTPSIFCAQDTINLETMQPETLTITGRHDPCIAVRAVPAIECAAALVFCDFLL